MSPVRSEGIVERHIDAWLGEYGLAATSFNIITPRQLSDLNVIGEPSVRRENLIGIATEVERLRVVWETVDTAIREHVITTAEGEKILSLPTSEEKFNAVKPIIEMLSKKVAADDLLCAAVREGSIGWARYGEILRIQNIDEKYQAALDAAEGKRK